METQPTKIANPDATPPSRKINRAAAIAAIVLSLIALFTVLSGFFLPPQPPETDEGTAAHIFQLSIAALFPTLITFLATANWKTPWRSMRPLLFPAAALTVAFTVLFYVEHHH